MENLVCGVRAAILFTLHLAGRGDFSLQAADITGDGVDELLACCWDGTTYIIDTNFDCCIFTAESDTLAFLACHLSFSESEKYAPMLSLCNEFFHMHLCYGRECS